MTEEELKKCISSAVGEKFEVLLRALMGETQSKYALFDWLDYWYVEFKEKHVPPLSENGLYQIRNCIAKHLKSNLPNKPLNELTALDCKECFGKISSSRMAVYAYDTLNDSLNCAVAYDELKKNPLLQVEKPKHKREKKLPLKRIYSFIRPINSSA